MTTKHTPGSWHVCKAPTLVADSDNRMIATVGFGLTGEEIANARLIAAAPDLLAACERFVRNGVCSCPEGGEGFVCDICEARAAIAKATP